MVDTITIEFKCDTDSFNEPLSDALKRCGFEVIQTRRPYKHRDGTISYSYKCHLIGNPTLHRPNGLKIPAGRVRFFTRKYHLICRVEFEVGTLLYGDNNHLLSFLEVERSLKAYLEALANTVPFVLVETGRATRVDVYYQWRIEGQYPKQYLAYYLGESGSVRDFYINGRGDSAYLKRTTKHAVRIYDKTKKALETPTTDASVTRRIPDSIIRLEVELRDDANEVMSRSGNRAIRSARAHRIGKKAAKSSGSQTPLRRSGVMVSAVNAVDRKGEIFNPERIVEVLQKEFPGIFLSPAINAEKLIKQHGSFGSTALVLHTRPYIRVPYLLSKGENKSKYSKRVREVIKGKSDSFLAVPDWWVLEVMMSISTSTYYIQTIHADVPGDVSGLGGLPPVSRR